MRKLPYIPDKKLYSAVMFACKMIRENGYFNKDCKIAANYYKVSEEEVRRYVRMAQGNGQKIANQRKGKRKYHWYAVVFVPDWEPNWDRCGASWTYDYTTADYVAHAQIAVVRALNERNAESNVMGLPDDPDLAIEDYGGFRWRRVMGVEEFDTKKEAEAYADSLGDKELERIVIGYLDEIKRIKEEKGYRG